MAIQLASSVDVGKHQGKAKPIIGTSVDGVFKDIIDRAMGIEVLFWQNSIHSYF